MIAEKSVTNSWIQSASNAVIDFLNPDPSSFNIEDIALALSRQPRYSGQGMFFYSVAQHSMYVAATLPPSLRLHGLLHDAHEAYTGDIPGPLKDLLGDTICTIEHSLQTAIYDGLGIQWPSDTDMQEVYRVDKAILLPECDALFTTRLWQSSVEPLNIDIIEWDMEEVMPTFLAYYNSIRKRSSFWRKNGNA